MKKRWDYNICPICGCALDVGEKCDCETIPDNAQEDQGAGQQETNLYGDAKTA